MPEKGLAEKKSQARGGEKSKSRLSIAFFVNATGEKTIEPLVVWRSKKPCCFKNIKSLSRPHGYYYSNPKVWMTTEIMMSILSKINRQMEVAKRKIILFMYNAPCHSEGLSERYCNIKVVFLLKNTTSRLQPLDAGITRNFKLKYRKKFLKFVISRINDNVKATDIIQEVDVLKAIYWVKSARGEVSQETIVNCFKKYEFRKSQPGVQLVSQEEDEEEFESLVKGLSTDVSAAGYIDFDRDIVTSQPLIDVKNIAWRQESRQNAIVTL